MNLHPLSMLDAPHRHHQFLCPSLKRKEKEKYICFTYRRASFLYRLERINLGEGPLALKLFSPSISFFLLSIFDGKESISRERASSLLLPLYLIPLPSRPMQSSLIAVPTNLKANEMSLFPFPIVPLPLFLVLSDSATIAKLPTRRVLIVNDQLSYNKQLFIKPFFFLFSLLFSSHFYIFYFFLFFPSVTWTLYHLIAVALLSFVLVLFDLIYFFYCCPSF